MATNDRKLAGKAKKLSRKAGRHPSRLETAVEHEWTDPQRKVLELIGRGMPGHKAAMALLDTLAPNKSKGIDYRKRLARQKVRNWTRSLWFRDALWNHTVTKVDLQTGPVMEGMVRAARRGRVDAAKLVLAVAGRHSEHHAGEGSVNVQVVFAEIPRPDRAIELPPGDVEEL